MIHYGWEWIYAQLADEDDVKVASDDGDDDDDDIHFDLYHCIISCIISSSFVDSKVRTFDNSCLVLSGDDFLEVRVSNQIVRKIYKMSKRCIVCKIYSL